MRGAKPLFFMGMWVKYIASIGQWAGGRRYKRGEAMMTFEGGSEKVIQFKPKVEKAAEQAEALLTSALSDSLKSGDTVFIISINEEENALTIAANCDFQNSIYDRIYTLGVLDLAAREVREMEY